VLPDQRRLVATARPGADLATLASTESRLATRHPDWQIRIIPPPTMRLTIKFAEGSAALEGPAAADFARARWALARWNITRVTATGRIASTEQNRSLALARATAVASALIDEGLTAAPAIDLPGPIQRAAEREAGADAFRTVTLEFSE
jgi:outer membrane protein OmpA-like peptidoglycan-associated protein